MATTNTTVSSLTFVPSMEWRKEITPAQWRALLAGHVGWLLDGFDVMLYAFALLKIKEEFSLSGMEAGALASVTLVAGAFGGTLGGFLSDRIGRARVLIYSILCYSIFTGLTATAHSVGALILWRALVGIGFGAEWSAGSVLIAETWPDRHRGKGIGLMQSGWAFGYMGASLLSAWIVPAFGWRVLFLLGILPALVTLWIRRKVEEPEIWKNRSPESKKLQVLVTELFQPIHLRRILISSSLATTLLFAFWGLFTWLPTYLCTPVSQGGAGLSVLKSAAWMVPMELGAALGFMSFGLFSDFFGRKKTFLVFVLATAALVPLYALAGRQELFLIILGPFLGFFGHGYFSLFGALLAELFPTSIRATAQGFCYNSGRAVSALAPMTIGYLADGHGVGAALTLTSAFFILSAVLICFLPETIGESLE